MSPLVDEDLRSARRRIAREHHPDRGGSTQVYLDLLRELEDRTTGTGTSAPTVHRSPAGRLKGWWRSAAVRARSLRAALPTHLPGSRRFGNLS